MSESNTKTINIKDIENIEQIERCEQHLQKKEDEISEQAEKSIKELPETATGINELQLHSQALKSTLKICEQYCLLLTKKLTLTGFTTLQADTIARLSLNIAQASIIITSRQDTVASELKRIEQKIDDISETLQRPRDKSIH